MWFCLQTPASDYIKHCAGENGDEVRYECMYCRQLYKQLHHLRRHQTAKHGRQKKWTRNQSLWKRCFSDQSHLVADSSVNTLRSCDVSNTEIDSLGAENNCRNNRQSEVDGLGSFEKESSFEVGSVTYGDFCDRL